MRISMGWGSRSKAGLPSARRPVGKLCALGKTEARGRVGRGSTSIACAVSCSARGAGFGNSGNLLLGEAK